MSYSYCRSMGLGTRLHTCSPPCIDGPCGLVHGSEDQTTHLLPSVGLGSDQTTLKCCILGGTEVETVASCMFVCKTVRA